MDHENRTDDKSETVIVSNKCHQGYNIIYMIS